LQDSFHPYTAYFPGPATNNTKPITASTISNSIASIPHFLADIAKNITTHKTIDEHLVQNQSNALRIINTSHVTANQNHVLADKKSNHIAIGAHPINDTNNSGALNLGII
jgi:hypothetical protein